MRFLLAVAFLAGVISPPTALAQLRLAPRSFGTPRAVVTGNLAPIRPLPAPTTTFAPLRAVPAPLRSGGSFNIVRSLPSEARPRWSEPGPRGGRGRGFGARRLHGQQFLFVNPWLFPFAFPYQSSNYWSQFYPSLWQPLDAQYLQARQIAQGDVAGEVEAQKNDLLTSQIQELSQEVESLREERASRQAAPPAASYEAAVPQKSVPTTFVYRDGHELEAQNYAIFGQTLWVFGAETTRKIPLSALNLPATRKLNEERGIDLPVPDPQ